MTYPNAPAINAALFNIVRNVCVELQVPMTIPGAEYPKGADSFVKFSMLAIAPSPARPEQSRSFLSVEILCYHKHGALAEDGKIYGHLELAQHFINLFHQTRIMVNTSCLQFREAKLIALDLKALGQFNQVSTQPSSSLNLNVAAIESIATINERI